MVAALHACDRIWALVEQAEPIHLSAAARLTTVPSGPSVRAI
jgi:hypothetical protein